MKKMLFVLFSILTLLIVSCEYQPTGTNFVNVDSNFTPANIQIVLPANVDTIFLDSYYVPQISYNLAGELSRFAKVIFFIDTTQFYSSTKNSGSINPPLKYPDSTDYYELNMIVLTKSGTGSLADLLNMEGVLYHKKYVICYYNTKAYKAKPLNFIEVDGKLKIEWEKYPYSNFSRYVIKKSIQNIHPMDITVGYVYNQEQNFIIDDAYIGEAANYLVAVEFTHTSNNFYYPETFKEMELPEIKYKVIDNKTMRFEWDKPKYYASAKNFRIYDSRSVGNFNIVISDINKGYFDYKHNLLGERLNCIFNVEPINNADYAINVEHPNFHKKIDIIFGNQSFKYLSYSAGADNFVYYRAENDSKTYLLNQFDCNSSKTINSLIIDKGYFNFVNTSPRGNYIVHSSGDVVNVSKRENFPMSITISKANLPNENQGNRITNADISDNGIVVIRSNSGYIYFYDIIKNEFLFSTNLENLNSISKLTISSDGKYFALSGDNGDFSIYEIIEKEIKVKLEKLSCYNFDFLTNNKMIYENYKTKEMFLINYESMQVEKSISNINFPSSLDIELGILYCYDYYHNFSGFDINAGFKKVNEFQTGSVSSGMLIKRNICYKNNGVKWEIK